MSQLSQVDLEPESDQASWRKERSTEFTKALLEFADGLAKKKKKTPFAIYVLEQARLTREGKATVTPAQSAQELRSMVCQLDETHKKTSKVRRATEFLEPFINGITHYSAVIDMLVSSDPTVSALVWGGFKFVLQIAGEHAQQYSDLTEILSQLGNHLEFLGRLSGVFDWSKEQSSILMKSYQDILLVLEAASEAYSQSGLRQVLVGTFSKKYKTLTERLEKNMQAVRDSALAANSYLMRKLAEDNERKKMNEWLQAPAIDPTYSNCLSHRHPSTCDWLFDEPTYIAWETTSKRQSNENTIWIYGPPGIGKTFLASSVIKRLKDKESHVIYYYFRDEKSGNPLQPGKGEALSMLRYLIRQLVDIVSYKLRYALPKSFTQVYEESSGTPLSNIDSAIRAVQCLLDVIPRVHVVVDGLDECIDRHSTTNCHSLAWKSDKLLPSILERLVRSNSRGIVKWCFTGCGETDFASLFKRLDASTLEVTGDRVRNDVLEYMTSSCGEALEVDEANLTMVFSQFLDVTQNFLDAKLTMDLVWENRDVANPVELLQSLLQYREGFNARYLRGIRALASRPGRERDLGRRILSFVATAERPLSRNELLDALAINLELDTTVFHQQLSHEKFEELLAPLLELDKSTDYSNPTVRFIHRTAMEFMGQESHEIEGLTTDCKDFFPTMESRNLELGKVCLAYLSRETFQFPSASEKLEHSLNDLVEENHNPFLRYASIFWHQHLKESSASLPLFERISHFMHSTNFLTCLWVQSKYAPYLLTRYTAKDDSGRFRIQNATAVFLPNPKAEVYYPDPLPGWLSDFNEDGAQLVRGCQLLIREFGLVLLRRRGGIQDCHPCCLGALNFLPPEAEKKWKILTLEANRDIRASSSSDSSAQIHLLSVALPSDKGTIVRTFSIQWTSDHSPELAFREWDVNLSRKKKSLPKLKREVSLPLPGQPVPTDSTSNLALHDTFAIPDTNSIIVSLGFAKLDLLKVDIAGSSVADVGFTPPHEHMSHYGHPSEARHSTFHGRGYAGHEDISAVSYRWVEGSKANVRKRGKGARPRMEEDSDSDSDADSDSGFASTTSSDSESDDDSEAESRPYDSGYSSGGATSSIEEETQDLTWHASIGIRGPGSQCRWHHFQTAGPCLRQSAPLILPTAHFVLMPLDSNKTAVIDYLTGECREISEPSTDQAISRVYHLCPAQEKIFELVTTRDFLRGSQWNVQLNLVVLDVDNSDHIDCVSISRTKISTVSWMSPYTNPYEHPSNPALPFTITWTDEHVYLVLGACEVYVVRMLLDTTCGTVQEGGDQSGQVETSSSSSRTSSPQPGGDHKDILRPLLRQPKVETIKKAAFLPASTTERAFTYVPYRKGEEEYAVFAVAGTRELPPFLLRQHVETDLGGWIEYDESTSTHIGHDGSEEDGDMKGKYSCQSRTFEVPIRSGLAWNTRVVVECGGG